MDPSKPVAWEDVEARLRTAIERLNNCDRHLFSADVNERSLTHKLAEYLQQEFQGWNVDCEYNRQGNLPKRLKRLASKSVPQDDTDARTVYPDIIVHLRGTDINLLVIEGKKQGVDDTTDRDKLRDFLTDQNYAYCYGVQVFFDINCQQACFRRFTDI